LHLLPSKSVVQISYLEGNISAASREIRRILWTEGSLLCTQLPQTCTYLETIN